MPRGRSNLAYHRATSTIVQPSYSIHLSLYTGTWPLDDPPTDTDRRVLFEDLFDPLPDNADHATSFVDRPNRRSLISSTGLPESTDKRFGPIRIDWADRVGVSSLPAPSEMSSAAPASPSTSSFSPSQAAPDHVPSTAPPAPEMTTPTRKPRRRVFHSAKPQVTAPVASFEKQASFQVDEDIKRRPKDGKGVARKEAFEGMTIGSTEVAFGIVHLFKDRQDAAVLASAPSSTDTSERERPQQQTTAAPAEQAAAENQLSDEDVGSIVAVLAIPSYLTAADFLSFVEPASEAICHLRMVRDVHPNRCMVLIKFRDASDAEDFHKMFNGQPFNAMDPEEICQVVYVTCVAVSKQSTLPLTYPMLSNSDPWPLKARPSTSGSIGSGAGANVAGRGYGPPDSGSAVADGLASTAGYELPTCPVCLERMDSSVTGLMTITCQHTFHCSCLSKWEEGRCPVCRYSQAGHRKRGSSRGAGRRHSRRTTPSGTVDLGELGEAEPEDDGSDGDEDEFEPSLCTICKTNQDLWVCLICASVGCGRYKAGHAHRHFEETGHLYSLELETQRVWDYAGDGYVHRLIQNKADGKLVELPSASSAAATPERSRRRPTSTQMRATASGSRGLPKDGQQRGEDPVGDGGGGGTDSRDESLMDQPGSSSSAFATSEKIEAIGLEYSYLLTSQLESQRHYYEEKVERVQTQLEGMLSKMQSLETSAERLEHESQRASRLEAEREELLRDKAKADRRAEKMMELARKFESEMQTERSLSEGLMRKLDKQRDDEARLQGEVQELKEQVRDLMFYMQARDKVEQEGGEELRGGDLEVKQCSSSLSKKKKGKKK